MEIDSIPCPICGRSATRAGVYRGQYIQAETGPVGGKKNPIDPKDENLSQSFREFEEAAGEIAHEYAKEDERQGRRVPRRDLVREAKDHAFRKDQRIKAGSGERRIGERTPSRANRARKAV